MVSNSNNLFCNLSVVSWCLWVTSPFFVLKSTLYRILDEYCVIFKLHLIPLIHSHSLNPFINVHHLMFPIPCSWSADLHAENKTQPKQSNEKITIWPCFSISADLCFCFQPFFDKKGFPTPSELEEHDGLKKKKQSPPAFPNLIEKRLFIEDLQHVLLYPPCFTTCGVRPRTCATRKP